MTNIALTFSQGHPSSLQTVNSIARSFPHAVPFRMDLVGITKSIIKTFNKGFIADITLLLTSSVEDTSRGGETINGI